MTFKKTTILSIILVIMLQANLIVSQLNQVDANPYPVPIVDPESPMVLIITKCFIWKKCRVSCGKLYMDENTENIGNSYGKIKINYKNEKTFQAYDELCTPFCELDHNDFFILDKGQTYYIYYRDGKMIFQNVKQDDDFLISEQELDCHLCILNLHSVPKKI